MLGGEGLTLNSLTSSPNIRDDGRRTGNSPPSRGKDGWRIVHAPLFANAYILAYNSFPFVLS